MTGQAAGKPEGNEGLDQWRAWIREELPKKDNPNAKYPGGKSKGRSVYARELEGGGCLLITEEGNHRVVAKFSPPEGEGWKALYEEEGQVTTGNRWKAKQERKEAAREGERKRERVRALNARTDANRRRGIREGKASS